MVTQRSGGPVVFLGLDAGSPKLVRGWVEDGLLPNFASVIDRGASAVVEHEAGLYVGSVWPTLTTGVGVSRHGFYTGIRPAPYSYDYVAEAPRADPFWSEVSSCGRRVAVVDVPFGRAVEGLDGIQLMEWGCHDRYYGPHAEPPEFLDRVHHDVGIHPIGSVDHPRGLDRFAPCDHLHLRDDRTRGTDELVAFDDAIVDAMVARSNLSKYVGDQGPFDLIVDVVSELHCGGHHLWAVHDVDHPDHDPEALRRIGSDPLLAAYQRADDLVGQYLERVGESGTLFVLLSHGMQAHYDGTHLLDEILWRLDQAYRAAPTPWVGGSTARAARMATHVPTRAWQGAWRLAAPVVARGPGRRVPQESPEPDIPGLPDRLWYQLENNTVSGAVRFNRRGREPHGLLGQAAFDQAARWLIDELRSLVSIDDGRPVIDEVYLSSDLYQRSDDDGLPDLLVEWVHDRPIERVWSPTIGTLRRPYRGIRTGDHDGVGELFAVGPGIEGRTSPPVRTVDIAPTVAASVGVHLSVTDGVPIPELLPGPVRSDGALARGVRALDARVPRRPLSPPTASGDLAALRREIIDLNERIDGLAAAHHTTWETANEARTTVTTLFDVLATTSWIRSETVGSDLRLSVVTPTCGRIDRLRRAVESVRAQTYTGAVELVIVDDASTDDTRAWLAGLDDEWIRVVRNDVPRGEGGSRNLGLDLVTGDVVCFLDDDNTFDPDWLRSVAWLFENHPETEVAYGARVVDDVERHHGREGRGLPWLQLNRWDRAVNAERCLVDVNVLAHRRSSRRFDPDLPIFTDWDYLCGLTVDVDPVALPVIAAQYTTSAPDRASDRWRDESDALYHRVRDRWRLG